MNKQQRDASIFAILLLLIGGLTVFCLLAGGALGIAMLISPKSDTPTDSAPPATDAPSAPSASLIPNVTLAEGPDAGMEYIDRMIFFGESTTAHLASRGVLSGGTDTQQVWKDSSGTKRLSSALLSETVIYPPTGEHLTISEALAKEQPEYIVLSFGLNGITDFVANKDSYVRNYNSLINAIQAASPNTRIILQSIYPVTASCNTWNEDGTTISDYTRILNQLLPEIAAAHENVRYVNTAEVLTDGTGCLDIGFDASGDGIHLSKSAYEQIIYYLRTHPWQETSERNETT
ncbi:MAG: hypothetical protein IKC31_01820 [Clostridia bacterium]|nr:hypothetical protein [Clostridia bacterium]MBR2926300.1 hypothetical protein [Clostridia bacterium]